jgi:hypothetical protein
MKAANTQHQPGFSHRLHPGPNIGKKTGRPENAVSLGPQESCGVGTRRHYCMIVTNASAREGTTLAHLKIKRAAVVMPGRFLSMAGVKAHSGCFTNPWLIFSLVSGVLRRSGADSRRSLKFLLSGQLAQEPSDGYVLNSIFGIGQPWTRRRSQVAEFVIVRGGLRVESLCVGQDRTSSPSTGMCPFCWQSRICNRRVCRSLRCPNPSRRHNFPLRYSAPRKSSGRVR